MSTPSPYLKALSTIAPEDEEYPDYTSPIAPLPYDEDPDDPFPEGPLQSGEHLYEPYLTPIGLCLTCGTNPDGTLWMVSATGKYRAELQQCGRLRVFLRYKFSRATKCYYNEGYPSAEICAVDRHWEDVVEMQYPELHASTISSITSTRTLQFRSGNDDILDVCGFLVSVQDVYDGDLVDSEFQRVHERVSNTFSPEHILSTGADRNSRARRRTTQEHHSDDEVSLTTTATQVATQPTTSALGDDGCSAILPSRDINPAQPPHSVVEDHRRSLSLRTPTERRRRLKQSRYRPYNAESRAS